MGKKKQFVGKLEFPVQIELGPGLEGAITNETKIGYVDGAKGWLVYRGYNAFDLAKHSTYEETTYLLLYGRLPNKVELETFTKEMAECREVPSEVIDCLGNLPKDTHAMSMLRTGVSALGCFDDTAEDVSQENIMKQSVKLVSRVATIAAAVQRLRKGQEPVAPDPSLGHTANFLYMATGEKPDDYTARVMDISMVLHADHGMNASTFTSMVTISTVSDIYSAVVSGIGALKGPAHGGANMDALAMLEEIDDPARVDDWVKQKMAEKYKFPGFGHRVYKAYDPRAKILGEYCDEVTKRKGTENLYQVAIKVEEKIIEAYGGKGIFPNVDFYTGTIYKSLGIEPDIFTVIFAVSRTAGWVARCAEYKDPDKFRIFRPRAVYTGDLEAKYVKVDDR